MSDLLRAQSCCAKYGWKSPVTAGLLPCFLAVGYELFVRGNSILLLPVGASGYFAGMVGGFAGSLAEGVGTKALPKLKYGIKKSGKILRAVQIAAYLVATPVAFLLLNHLLHAVDREPKQYKSTTMYGQTAQTPFRQKELYQIAKQARRFYLQQP